MKIVLLVEEFAPPWNEGYKNIAKYIREHSLNKSIQFEIFSYKDAKRSKRNIINVIKHQKRIALINFNYPDLKVLTFLKLIKNKKIPLIKFHMKSDFINSIRYKYILLIHDYIFTTSRYLKTLIANDAILARKECFYIGIPIPTDFYHPINDNYREKLRNLFGIPNDALVLTYTGRILQRKEVLLVTKFLENKLDKNKVIMVICASNPREEIIVRKIINDEKHENIVTINTNKLPNGDIRYMYWVSDLLLYPVKQENSIQPPLTVLESLSCGTPVMALKTSSILEVVRDQFNGFVFKNLQDLYDKIQLFSSMSQREIARLKRNSRTFIMKEYNCEKIVKNIINTINTLI